MYLLGGGGGYRDLFPLGRRRLPQCLMNGRRPDPLDALSAQDGVVFSQKGPNS